jgi:prepilin-type N-terminal cleavage/methylation domain-containing protein
MARYIQQRHRLCNRCGVNLIELMIVSVISTIILAGLWVVFSAGRNTYFTTEAKLSMREQTRKVFHVLSLDLRDARLSSWCLDLSNSCTGGLAASLVFQEPISADPFFDDEGIHWAADDVAYKWTNTPGTPTPLYRCSPAGEVPPSAKCWVLANRVTALTITPLPTTGAPYPSPVNDFSAVSSPTNAVTMSITIAPERYERSGSVPAYQSQTRVVLLNPQT